VRGSGAAPLPAPGGFAGPDVGGEPRGGAARRGGGGVCSEHEALKAPGSHAANLDVLRCKRRAPTGSLRCAEQ
jgi:hypothetical protein